MNIASAEFETSAPRLSECPVELLPEFAFIGRSNVGKSSLLNMLSRREALARVSKTPGFTKMINFFRVNKKWYLVDLPGYGYAKVAREEMAQFNEAVEEYLANRGTLACVFLLVDSRHSPQDIDLQFVHWMACNTVPFVLVFTKMDAIKPALLAKNVEAFKQSISGWFENMPEVIICSSETGQGRIALLSVIERALADADEAEEEEEETVEEAGESTEGEESKPEGAE